MDRQHGARARLLDTVGARPARRFVKVFPFEYKRALAEMAARKSARQAAAAPPPKVVPPVPARGSSRKDNVAAK